MSATSTSSSSGKGSSVEEFKTFKSSSEPGATDLPEYGGDIIAAFESLSGQNETLLERIQAISGEQGILVYHIYVLITFWS